MQDTDVAMVGMLLKAGAVSTTLNLEGHTAQQVYVSPTAPTAPPALSATPAPPPFSLSHS
jgi:hypothetical protein